MGLTVIGGTPEEFATLIRDDIAMFKRVATEVKLTFQRRSSGLANAKPAADSGDLTKAGEPARRAPATTSASHEN